MPKKAWLDYKKQFQALQKKKCPQSQSMSGLAEEGSGAAQDAAGARATSSGSQAAEETGETVAPAVSSTAPAAVGNPRVRQGCLVRISDFSQPQTRISVRQFVEHEVTVEYCDFTPGASVAHVRLKCPEDCHVLVDELAKSNRYLGWLRPVVSILSPEEEQAYWQAVVAQRSSAKAETGIASATLDVSRKQVHRITRNPLGVVVKRPSKTTTLHRFRGSTADAKKNLASSSSSSAPAPTADKGAAGSYVDIAGGSNTFSQAGFGKPRFLKKRLFGMKSRLRKIGADVSPALRPAVVSTVPPAQLPKSLKNIQIAPATQRPRQAPATQQPHGAIATKLVPLVANMEIAPATQSSLQGAAPSSEKLLLPPPPPPVKRPPRPLEAEAPPAKVQMTEFEPMLLPMLPPPSPGILLKSAKAKKYPAPQRASQDFLFPPPSPVAVPQDTRKQSNAGASESRKQKRSKSPGRQRKPATGVAPLLLPPPSPIARRAEERTSAVPLQPAPDDAAKSPGAGDPTGSVPAAPEDVPEKNVPKDSMLDQVDMDDFLSLMES
jgi:hypothetical protein